MKWCSIRGYEGEADQVAVVKYFNVARIAEIKDDTVAFEDGQSVQVSKHAAKILSGAVHNYKAQKVNLSAIDDTQTLAGQTMTQTLALHPKDLNTIMAYFEADTPYLTARNNTTNAVVHQPPSELELDRILQFRAPVAP